VRLQAAGVAYFCVTVRVYITMRLSGRGGAA
jgi:hypothetical protein